ncbi:MAG TPA: YfcE family phosphodiesterase [Gemmatales bacterium]|nr:YfcE family phosphodiesterase [Gemmatales bacterium]
MLLGIISDTHDHAKRTARAVQLFSDAGVEAIVHCGDICEPYILTLLAETPTYFVLGNNDNEPELKTACRKHSYLEYLGEGGIVTLGGKRLAVTHGHLGRTTRELLSQKPDYLLSGHTHVAHHEMVQGVTCINPGALHRVSEHTAAVLNLATNELNWLTIPKPDP